LKPEFAPVDLSLKLSVASASVYPVDMESSPANGSSASGRQQ